MVWNQKAFIGYFNSGPPLTRESTFDFSTSLAGKGNGLFYTAESNMIPNAANNWNYTLKYFGTYDDNQDLTEKPKIKNDYAFTSFEE